MLRQYQMFGIVHMYMLNARSPIAVSHQPLRKIIILLRSRTLAHCASEHRHVHLDGCTNRHYLAVFIHIVVAIIASNKECGHTLRYAHAHTPICRLITLSRTDHIMPQQTVLYRLTRHCIHPFAHGRQAFALQQHTQFITLHKPTLQAIGHFHLDPCARCQHRSARCPYGCY